MMKQLTAAILASALSIASLAAAPAPQTFPAPADLLAPERWEKNSSGAMSIAFDADEQALVFDVNFTPMSITGFIPDSDSAMARLFTGPTPSASSSKSARKTTTRASPPPMSCSLACIPIRRPRPASGKTSP